MATKKEEDKPVIGNLAENMQSRQETGGFNKSVGAERPASVPSMGPQAKIEDRGTFEDSRVDPSIARGEKSVLRSDSAIPATDYTPAISTLYDGVAPSPELNAEPSNPPNSQPIPEGVAQPTAEGDGPVIGERYAEIADPRINKLGFRRMVDRGTVSSENHLGIYTNLDDSTFNAEADLRDNMEGGGSLSVVPAAQMNAQLGGRRITGRLPSGATYTYHLKAGQLTPEEQMNSGVIRPQQTGDPEQDALNRAGASMANNRRRERARADERYQLNHATQLKEQQQARRLTLENDLIEYFRETDPELAKSLMFATKDQGAIPQYKPHTAKQYDEYGMQNGEHTTYYRTGADGSLEINDPSQVHQGQSAVSYDQALEAMRTGLKKKPELREQAIQKLMADYGDQFNEQDLN